MNSQIYNAGAIHLMPLMPQQQSMAQQRCTYHSSQHLSTQHQTNTES